MSDCQQDNTRLLGGWNPNDKREKLYHTQALPNVRKT
jgi:hypothetical protein